MVRIAATLPAALGLLAGTAADASAQGDPELENLAFMAGCWEGSFQARDGTEGIIEEHYTWPSANVMLGTTRYLLNGAALQFELTSISQTEQGITLLPYPGGTRSDDGFVLTATTATSATFSAPEHDFPKRILYRGDGPDRLVARIDDGTDAGQAREWFLSRAACPGS